MKGQTLSPDLNKRYFHRAVSMQSLCTVYSYKTVDTPIEFFIAFYKNKLIKEISITACWLLVKVGFYGVMHLILVCLVE